MSWIIIVLVIVGIVWLVKRNKNRQQPRQNMPQNRPNGGFNRPGVLNRPQQRNTNQQGTVGAGNKLCPFCAETIKAQATVCRFCGHQLNELSQQGNTVFGNGQQQATGGSMIGDAVKTGAAVMATQAILGGLMGQGQAQTGNNMPPDPSMMPGSDYPDDTDNPLFGTTVEGDDSSSFGNVMDEDVSLPGGFGNGLDALSNLGSSDDSNHAGWITDENDTDNSGWLSSGNDDGGSSLNWPFGSDDDSGSGNSWSFGNDDDSSVGSSWSFDDDD